MAWIESHQSLSRHRKTLRTAGRLSVDRHKLIGHLHELWWWALDNVGADGCLGDVTAYEIATAAEWDGDADAFLDALVEAGFIDKEGGALYLHDWYDYAGKLIERREAERERSRQRRAARRRPEDKPTGDRDATAGRPLVDHRKTDGTVPNRTVPNRIRPKDRQTARTREDPPPTPGEPESTPSVSQSGDPVEGDLPDPQDDMTIQDVAERYQQTIGIMGPSVFAQLQEWHEEHGMSCGALAEAIDRTAEARDDGRIGGNTDRYLMGVIRGMHNDGIRTVAQLRDKARSRADPAPLDAPDTPPMVSHRRRMADLDEQIRLAMEERHANTS